jgi:hypothetical protein
MFPIRLVNLADTPSELVFNVLWSYMEEMFDRRIYDLFCEKSRIV